MTRCKRYRIVKGVGKIEGQEHWHIQWNFGLNLGEDWYSPSGACHWSEEEAQQTAEALLADNASPFRPARFQG